MSERLTTAGEDMAMVAIGALVVLVVIALLVGLAIEITRHVEDWRARRGCASGHPKRQATEQRGKA